MKNGCLISLSFLWSKYVWRQEGRWWRPLCSIGDQLSDLIHDWQGTHIGHPAIMTLFVDCLINEKSRFLLFVRTPRCRVFAGRIFVGRVWRLKNQRKQSRHKVWFRLLLCFIANRMVWVVDYTIMVWLGFHFVWRLSAWISFRWQRLEWYCSAVGWRRIGDPRRNWED